MNLLKSYLVPPAAAPLAFLVAHLTLAEPMYFEALVTLTLMFYFIGLFFVLSVWSARWAFGLLESSQATFGAAILVAALLGLLLVIYPLNDLWAWMIWPIVLSCPLTALAMSATGQSLRHDADGT